MSNLIRPINKYLLNSVASGTTDVDCPSDTATGRKYFIHKKLGIAILGNLSGEASPRIHVNIKPGGAGTTQKATLKIVKLFNTATEKESFTITIRRKAAFNGSTAETRDVDHTYGYTKKSFTTSSNGAFDATDTADILEKLVARINADKQLGKANILTGAVVTASYVAAAGGVPAYILLEAKDASVQFEVLFDDDYFAANAITGVHRAGSFPANDSDSIARLFSVKPHDAGGAPVQPIAGTYYTEIEITERSAGADNVVASGVNTREQKTIIYVPNADADALADPIVAKLKEAALNVYKNNVLWEA